MRHTTVRLESEVRAGRRERGRWRASLPPYPRATPLARRVLVLQLIMDILTWLIVGLVAGLLASFAVGGTGYGIVGDIVIGIVGAFVGGFVFRALHINSPITGLGGVILVAFVGAVLLLLLLRVIRGSTSGRRA